MRLNGDSMYGVSAPAHQQKAIINVAAYRRSGMTCCRIYRGMRDIHLNLHRVHIVYCDVYVMAMLPSGVPVAMASA